MISGWLFDLYPLDNKMIFWIKQENGNTIRLEDSTWSHSIYVASDCNSHLRSIVDRIDSNDDGNDSIAPLVRNYEFVPRYEKITDRAKSDVLKLMLADSTKALTLARKIEGIDGSGNGGNNSSKFGKYRIYNVDLLPAQSYFYEHNIFPLAFCEIHSHGQETKLTWINKDDVWSSGYRVPDIKAIHIIVNSKKQGKMPAYTDKIHSITIKQHNETS